MGEFRGLDRLSSPIVFAVPGALDQLTGGYLFDRRVVESLRASGRTVRVAELAGQFPLADAQACSGARVLVQSLEPDSVLVIDGLALPAFESALMLPRGGIAIGFIHHPLSLETGLSREQYLYFARLESSLWSALGGLICASPSSARAVIASGIPRTRVAVASPGVDLPAELTSRRARGRAAQSPVRLLCVATLTLRKGHRVLIDALARLRALDWTLDCYGSLERDRDAVASVQRAIHEYGLSDRVRLHGEQPAERLQAAWGEADLFVLPSFHEGYGMVLTEAIAYGLPVVSTRAGAIPETVPAQASRLVEPGDVDALAGVLAELIRDGNELDRLTEEARIARSSLMNWPQALEAWRNALDGLVAQHKVVA